MANTHRLTREFIIASLHPESLEILSDKKDNRVKKVSPIVQREGDSTDYAVSDKYQVSQFTLFSFIRMLDNIHPSQPSTGYADSPSEDIVRFGQTPIIRFYPHDVYSVVLEENPDIPVLINNTGFGCFGPQGPMPLWNTEQLVAHTRTSKPFLDFYNIFHHRLISFLYRSWADVRPDVSHERSVKTNDDAFGQYLAAIAGVQSVRARALPPDCLSGLAGLFTHKRSSRQAVVQVARLILGCSVSLKEFQSSWQTLSGASLTHLGGCNAHLGVNAIAGRQIRIHSSHYLLVLGPLSFEQYQSLVHDTARFEQLKRQLLTMTGSTYQVSVELWLEAMQSQPSRFGKAQLGITSWCQSQGFSQQQNTPQKVSAFFLIH